MDIGKQELRHHMPRVGVRDHLHRRAGPAIGRARLHGAVFDGVLRNAAFKQLQQAGAVKERAVGLDVLLLNERF